MQKFLARQPIFTPERAVYGYELLFRSSPENSFDRSQPDFAAASSTDSLFLFGIDRLTDGRRAFINCTREFLVRDFPTLLPKDRIVVEILETVHIDEQVLGACDRLKKAGYLIALDDYQDTPEWQRMIAFADFLKIDLQITPPEEQRRLVRTYSSPKLSLVAERVETYEVFERTLHWGYSYFQGYFFARPQMLTRHDVPAFKLNYLRVLQAANRPVMDIREISECIKAETSLSYRLLRYLNSPVFPLITEVKSIPHALSLLGERGVRKWISLVAIACMGDGKPFELITLPLIRARFCELLARPAHMAENSNDLFLLGLLSAVDAILDLPMEEVLREITIHPDIRAALLGHQNKYRQIFDISQHYEKGDWDAISATAASLGISERDVPDLYLQSVSWARSVLTGDSSKEPANETAGVLRSD